MTERNTRIRAGQIVSVKPNDLESTNSPVDDYIPSYDLTTGKFTWIQQSAGGGNSVSYTSSFTNASLSSAGILTVNHNLNVTYPLVVIYDNNNLEIEPDEIEYKTVNQIEIDLSSFISISGTWNIRVISVGSSISNLGDLTNVDFDSGTPNDEDVLRYNYSAGKWKAEPIFYTSSFTNASLSSGDILTVSHNLGKKYVIVQVYDNSDKLISVTDVELKTTNSLELDFTGIAPITGT